MGVVSRSASAAAGGVRLDGREHEPGEHLDQFGLRPSGAGRARCVGIGLYRTGRSGRLRGVVLGHRRHLFAKMEKRRWRGRPRMSAGTTPSVL
jgi:hypothetical protein